VYYVPSNGTQVSEGNSDKKGETSANEAANPRSIGRFGSHAAHLKVESAHCTVKKEKERVRTKQLSKETRRHGCYRCL
jgi:hypothetical protein